MTSAKEKIQAMIRRKIAKNKEIKEKLQDRADPSARIIRFLSEFDDLLKEAPDNTSRYWLIEEEPKRLLADLRLLDPGVAIELVWFGDEPKDLRLEGVRVTWTSSYCERKVCEPVQLFDLASILFQ